MSKQINMLLTVLALAALGYFIYEFFALPNPTSAGYACLFLGCMVGLYKSFKSKKKA